MKVRIEKIDVLSARDHGVLRWRPWLDALPVAGAGAHIVLEIPGPGRVWKNAYSLVSAPATRGV